MSFSQHRTTAASRQGLPTAPYLLKSRETGNIVYIRRIQKNKKNRKKNKKQQKNPTQMKTIMSSKIHHLACLLCSSDKILCPIAFIVFIGLAQNKIQ